VRQGAVHVGGCQPDGPGPDREPRSAGILSLDREQPLGDRDRAPGQLARQQLRREPPIPDQPVLTSTLA
jgi:hypothetical protein